jgi:hypothetical protein
LLSFSAINDAPALESSRALNIIISGPFFIVTNTIGTNGSSIDFNCGLREPATFRALTTLVLEKEKQ